MHNLNCLIKFYESHDKFMFSYMPKGYTLRILTEWKDRAAKEYLKDKNHKVWFILFVLAAEGEI